MTDNPEASQTPNEEKDDLYDVFSEVRQSLTLDESEEQDAQRKSVLQKIKGIRIPKFSRKKKEVAAEEEAVEDTSEELDAQLEREAELLVQRLVITENFVDDEFVDAEEDEADLEEELEEEISIALPPESKEPRLTASLEKDAENIRDIALEDYTEEELEKIDERKIAWLDFIQAPSSQMRWIEWVGILLIGLTVGGLIIWLGIRATGGLHLSEPVPTNTPDPNIPVPVEVELPGGWSFRLRKGSLSAEGQWEPFGAEWLQGTEICKWIALPWSTQLEAVIQTLESGDPIEVTMSNYDVLTYHVYSRKKVDSTQAEELNLDTPSVLIVLVSEDSDQKLVLTAVLDYENIE